ncbi:hypothetical protein BKA93DRAFT_771087 [Sparassis latifolia]
MSARTPFIPQRTTSRPAPADQSKPSSNSAAHSDAFRPNGLLHPSSGSPPSADDSAYQQKQPDPPSLLNGINKPLNLSGLSKKKSSQPHKNTNSIKSGKHLDDSHTRSPKDQQALRVTVPRPSSPFFPNSSGFIATNSFRSTSLAHTQNTPSLISGDDFSSNNAHISTSASPASDGPLAATQGSDRIQYSQAFDSSALMRASARSSSRPSLEKIHEVAEEDLPLESYEAATREDERREFSVPAVEDLDNYPGRFATSSGRGNEDDAQQTLRRTSKRIQRPEDHEELEYGNVTKKYKMDTATNDFKAPPYSRNSPAASYLHDQGAITEHQRRRSHSHVNSQFEPPHADLVASQAQPDKQQVVQGLALHRLLGQDLDIYVEAHVEAYEQAKKKWSECSMDEWKTGADELASKFTEMLDFVKAHMISKLALYASLQSTVSAHRDVLSEREKVLKEARESLVREGGNVVSGKGAVMCATGQR